MRLSAESLLALLILLLFLKDSLWLLRHDEAVMVCSLRKRWRYGFGARSWQLLHREPYLLNPFLPHQPAFRLRWDMTGLTTEVKKAENPLAQFPAQLQLLGIFAWLAWVELLALMLALVPMKITGLPLLVIVGMIYLTILALIVALFVWRRELNMHVRTVVRLGFECLVCPPYTANIVRRVSALRLVTEDFNAAAEALLSAPQFYAAKGECLARLDDQIDADPTESGNRARLLAARSRFLVENENGDR